MFTRGDDLLRSSAVPIRSAMRLAVGRGILGRIEVIFFVILVLVVGAVWAYQHFDVDPVQRMPGIAKP